MNTFRTSLVLVLATSSGAFGCMSLPATTVEPTTKDTVTSTLAGSAVGKVDLLFAIDDSASMGDKQEFLAKAVPDLVSRLVQPNCVNASGVAFTGADGSAMKTDASGKCAQGAPEFTPVRDLHIAVVSSSLATPSSGVCPKNATNLGHVVPADLGNDQGANFLSWFPAGPRGAQIGDVAKLQESFKSTVTSVGSTGCGIESQLESWYRFLVQPDPYNDISVADGVATWDGVDTTILSQRREFLRPDSLVAVMVLSDENDSAIDVRANGGKAYNYLDDSYQPFRGTSACAVDSSSPDCMSCETASETVKANDPSCQLGRYTLSSADLAGDSVGLRHVHMKEKYGIDLQYPIARYVDGLSRTTVPNRFGEYPHDTYEAKANCTNPLFAAQLPDGSDVNAATLCNLPKGKRTANQVFYGIIGGVPHQLLHLDPKNPASITAPLSLSDADWQKILGSDPEKGITAGIDAHMIESTAPRSGLPGPDASMTADAVSGREWLTHPTTAKGGDNGNNAIDLQYACTFKIAARDCSHSKGFDCDCPTKDMVPSDPRELPPVCDPNHMTQQIAAKAYPTPRELLVAKKLGAQGIVSSICPVDVDDDAPSNEFYGYRPAVSGLISRLKTELGTQCLPEALTPAPAADGSMQVPCAVLAILPNQGDESACNQPGLSVPSADILQKFIAQKDQETHATPAQSVGTHPICVVRQTPVASGTTCEDSDGVGYCYVENTADAKPAGKCPQAIVLTSGAGRSGALAGATFSLQCINQVSVQ